MNQGSFSQTPFASELTRRACEWRREWDGSPHPMFGDWLDGIFPAYRELASRIIAADHVRLHDFARAVTSSQGFAFNLFLPFREGSRDSLNRLLESTLGEPVIIERVGFEWIPPGALLGEIDGDTPRKDEPATGVDIVLWGRLHDSTPVAVLLEVKLGEGGFTTCGGRVSTANRTPEVCASAERFFANPSACYLTRPVRKARDRRYWEIFAASHGSVAAAFPGTDRSGPCPFARDAQQPMRNLAIARGLEQDGTVSRAWFGLCAHDQNPDVASHWAAWRRLLPDEREAPILPASAVIAAGREAGHGQWADWMEARYMLDVRKTLE